MFRGAWGVVFFIFYFKSCYSVLSQGMITKPKAIESKIDIRLKCFRSGLIARLNAIGSKITTKLKTIKSDLTIKSKNIKFRIAVGLT
jgi:hypothetical protein